MSIDAILAGSILEVRDEEDGLAVTIGGAGARRERFDRVVLCTGPETDVRRWTSSLFRQLLRDGLLQADPLGIGVVTDGSGRAIGPDRPTPWLFTIGGLLGRTSGRRLPFPTSCASPTPWSRRWQTPSA